MKKFIASLCALVALVGLAASPAAAQTPPAPRILVVDMARLLDNHHKTEEQNAKLRGDEARANEELEKINREGQVLVDELRKMEEDAKNPALSTSAREQLQTEMRNKIEEIQRKQNEVQSFRNNTQRSLQQRIQNFRKLMFEEISATVTEVAKRKGANLVLDRSGPTLIGINPVVFVDDAFDITDEVQAEINKTRPAGAARPAAAAPAVGGDGARVNFPGAGR